tara:strand:+ start:1480 stop:1725 length:246 start_codon:yes stop_codon:yes gene_type:complete
MNKQINIRLSKRMLVSAEKYAKNYGFSNVQEFIRETIREKLFKPEFTKKEIDLIAKFADVCEEKNLFGTEEDLDKALNRQK